MPKKARTNALNEMIIPHTLLVFFICPPVMERMRPIPHSSYLYSIILKGFCKLKDALDIDQGEIM